MKWFVLACVGLALGLALGVVGGLYAAGPERKVVTVKYVNEMTTEGECEMTYEAEEAQAAALQKFAQSGDSDDIPPEPWEDCAYYAEYGAIWHPPEYERRPVTRVERTNAWERITSAVTG
jgi:hypothetical protein